MIQSMLLVGRSARGRRLTFAYTRPLSPLDVSGMTGMMAPKHAALEASPKAGGLRGAMAAVRAMLRLA